MSIDNRTFWMFVAAVVATNVLTIFITAFIFRAAPGMKEHHPGF